MKINKFLILLTVGSIVIPACSLINKKQSELIGPTWVLKYYMHKSQEKEKLQVERKPFISFDKDNVVHGSGRIGSIWQAKYEIGKKNLTTDISIKEIEHAMVTIIPPYHPSKEERKQSEKFANTIQTAKSFEIKNNKLIIYCKDETMLVFEKEKS